MLRLYVYVDYGAVPYLLHFDTDKEALEWFKEKAYSESRISANLYRVWQDKDAAWLAGFVDGECDEAVLPQGGSDYIQVCREN